MFTQLYLKHYSNKLQPKEKKNKNNSESSINTSSKDPTVQRINKIKKLKLDVKVDNPPEYKPDNAILKDDKTILEKDTNEKNKLNTQQRYINVIKQLAEKINTDNLQKVAVEQNVAAEQNLKANQAIEKEKQKKKVEEEKTSIGYKKTQENLALKAAKFKEHIQKGIEARDKKLRYTPNITEYFEQLYNERFNKNYNEKIYQAVGKEDTIVHRDAQNEEENMGLVPVIAQKVSDISSSALQKVINVPKAVIRSIVSTGNNLYDLVFNKSNQLEIVPIKKDIQKSKDPGDLPKLMNIINDYNNDNEINNFIFSRFTTLYALNQRPSQNFIKKAFYQLLTSSVQSSDYEKNKGIICNYANLLEQEFYNKLPAGQQKKLQNYNDSSVIDKSQWDIEIQRLQDKQKKQNLALTSPNQPLAIQYKKKKKPNKEQEIAVVKEQQVHNVMEDLD